MEGKWLEMQANSGLEVPIAAAVSNRWQSVSDHDAA